MACISTYTSHPELVRIDIPAIELEEGPRTVRGRADTNCGKTDESDRWHDKQRHAPHHGALAHTPRELLYSTNTGQAFHRSDTWDPSVSEVHSIRVKLFDPKVPLRFLCQNLTGDGSPTEYHAPSSLLHALALFVCAFYIHHALCPNCRASSPWHHSSQPGISRTRPASGGDAPLL
ncbi:hypothetical protein SCP_0705450 [Sparassis crispa]|uniref:Uncharacterized protein n=1 Tax=Sparassis crispa TaxID=139825 RepID=A0A401GSZ5_9APHY|nr:hypothetical protein SCP_0705450 [Sparassis crispa]GBE85358.1 hypothetical protein SCP_0705450 [Sparassis crispa]